MTKGTTFLEGKLSDVFGEKNAGVDTIVLSPAPIYVLWQPGIQVESAVFLLLVHFATYRSLIYIPSTPCTPIYPYVPLSTHMYPYIHIYIPLSTAIYSYLPLSIPIYP